LLKKYFLKLISSALKIISWLITIIVIILITICIYIIINKSIIINDNNKIITKAISWYYDAQVSFDYIKIGSLNKKKHITIEVNKFKIENYKNYKNIQAENLKYNIYYSNLTKYKYYITNVELFEPIVIYGTNNKYNSITKKINNIISKIEDINIYNGKLVYADLEKKYYLSNINISKRGIKDLYVFGDFLYKDNNFYSEDKQFFFKSKKVLNNFNINLNFTELSLPNFITNIFNTNNAYSISGLYSGEAIINIQNNKIINTELKIHSNNSIIELKENINFNNFKIINIPYFNKISLSLFYDFNESLLKIYNLTFDIKNNLNIKSEIILSATKSLNTDLLNVNYIFNNIDINGVIEANNKYAILFLENLLSGTGNVSLLSNSINNVNLVINNFSYEKIFFKDIKFTYNKSLNNANIFFTLDGDYSSFVYLIKKYNITTYNFSALIKEQYINLNNYLSLKIQFPNISKSFDEYIIDIKGHLSSDREELFYINNFLYIKYINYFLNIDEDKINLSGLAKVNDVDINFNLNKINESKLNFNFNLNDKFFIDNNLSNKFKGVASVDCNVDSQIKMWLYSCNANFTNNIITIPALGFIKTLDEEAYLNFNGVINNNFLLVNNNFTYKHQDNLFEGDYNFDNTLNSYYINFNKFIYNNNNLIFAILFKDNLIDINISSGILDFTPFLTSNNSQKDFIPTIMLNANLKKLIIFDDIELDATKITSTNINNNLSIISNFYADETIDFNINTTKNNGILSYAFQASNAGHFFNLFDYKTEIKGGILSSEGFFGNLDNDNDLMGTLSIDNFRIMKAPLFAELLLAASFTGLFDVFNNEGIPFDQFDAQFTKKGNIFNIKKSRAYGFSLGLTGNGTVNSNDKSLLINGSIVPAYKLNTIFNIIPIIGDILSGKEDEGIFAINYAAKGSWKEPVIDVNPLSILTPGIIRNIFDY